MWAANRTFVNDALARGLLAYDPTYIQENDNWLAAEAKYKNQKAVIEQAQRAVNNAWLAYQAVSPIVTAPVSGIITNITYAEGMTLGGTSDTSQRIAVIRAEGNPLATFNLSEIDVAKVKPGQKATIKLDSLADKTFTGKVATVDRVGTVTSGVANYPVVIKFDTEAPEVSPNMSATANIILETKDNVLLVPSSAVRVQGEQNIVRVLKDKKEQAVVVETGLTSDSQTEILSGLSEGDEVITSVVTTTTRQGTSVFGGQLRIGGFGGAGFGGARR
jgi:RND family efflux transporter MFP subunit